MLWKSLAHKVVEMAICITNNSPNLFANVPGGQGSHDVYEIFVSESNRNTRIQDEKSLRHKRVGEQKRLRVSERKRFNGTSFDISRSKQPNKLDCICSG